MSPFCYESSFLRLGSYIRMLPEKSTMFAEGYPGTRFTAIAKPKAPAELMYRWEGPG